MSVTLKPLALMALAATLGLGFSAEATAGPCKRDQIRNGKGKCVSVPTALERAPELDRVATPEPAPPTSAALPVQPSERVTLGYGVSTPTLIRVPALPTFVVVACDMVTAINGTVGYTFMSQTTAVQSFGMVKQPNEE